MAATAGSGNDVNKLAGRLYLDLSQLAKDVGDANRLLGNIGNGIAPKISQSIAVAIPRSLFPRLAPCPRRHALYTP